MRAVVMLLLVALAGCTSAPSTEEVHTCEEESCQATVVIENETAPAKFALRGVVVDQIIMPVPHAEVELRKLSKPLASVTADADGAFTFHGLPEGFYNLFVEKGGHTGVLSNVYVKENMHAAMVQIIRVPEPVPTHILSVWEGMVDCSVVALIGVHGICPHEYVTGSSNKTMAWTFQEELTSPPDWVQAELYWESNQAITDTLRMRSYASAPDERRTYIDDAAGRSPLSISYNKTQAAEHRLGDPNGLYLYTTAGSPELLSADIVIEQPFTVYFSVLQNLEPPQGWMFVTDGSLA